MAITKFDGEYRWLSNFWETPVTYNGVTYKSVEHAYQALKTSEPWGNGDKELHDKIASAKDAKETKRLGKQIKMVNLNQWDAIKFTLMTQLVRSKFENPTLREKLIATGNQELIEGNWWGDTIWGVCKGVGTNWLGMILMAERERLNDDGA